MPEMLSRMLEQLKEFWSNLEKSQKNRILVISVILVAAIATSIVLVTRPSYMTLYKSSDSKEIGEMVTILKDANIWNEVTDNGAGIKINTKDNSAAQAALVQQGYPKSTGMTFEDAFSMIKINSTESDKKKLWDEYAAKSLATKLKAMDNVENAVVTLALPEKSLFVEKNEQKPTASVVVKPKGELTPKQVQGIVMMVARSVEGLNPKDIIVLDNNSNMLNSDSEDDSITAPTTQYEMTQKRKKDIEKNVREMFNGQFDNFDNIRVVANPVLDFNKLKSQSNIIQNPTGMTDGAEISKKTTSENLVNGQPGGEPGLGTNPGTAANAPSYPTGNGENSTYTKKTEEVNKEYTKTQTEEEKALGAMDMDKSSMTVALLYGNRVADDSKLTQEFIDSFKNDVSAATGIPSAKISVSKYKISPPVEPQKPVSDTVKEIINTYGLFALMLLLVIGLLIAAYPRRKPVQSEEEEAFAAAQAAGVASGPRFIVPETPTEPVPEIDLEERNEVKKQIEKFVRQKPDAVAQLLRNWLADDDWD